LQKKKDNVPGITRDLEAELQRLEQRRDTFREHVKNANAEIRRVKSAIRALGGDATGEGDGARASALTTAEVVQLIDEELPAQGTCTLADLRREVETAARAAGRTLIGFHLRFRKAVQSERFVVSGTGDAADVSRRGAADTETPG
jgi:hypothetical protein